MKEYEYLTEHVTMWNVAVERQIQVKGPDAEKFVDMVITRRASSCDVMKARYVILCNQYGGILNDPVMLRPAKDEFGFRCPIPIWNFGCKASTPSPKWMLRFTR